MKRWIAVTVVLAVLCGTVGVFAAPNGSSDQARYVSTELGKDKGGGGGDLFTPTGLIRPKGIW